MNTSPRLTVFYGGNVVMGNVTRKSDKRKNIPKRRQTGDLRNVAANDGSAYQAMRYAADPMVTHQNGERANGAKRPNRVVIGWCLGGDRTGLGMIRAQVGMTPISPEARPIIRTFV